MAEEIRLDVVSEAHSEGLTKTAAELKNVRGESDKLGKSFHDTDREASFLNEQIEHTRTRVRELREEFSRGGGSGLLGDLKRQESFLRDLERVAKAARADSQRQGLDFSVFGGSLRGALIPTVAVGVAAIAPALGAMVEGAVVGAVAGGGILGGIVAAAHDSRVQAEWSNFTKGLTKEAFGSESFVKPTIEGIHLIQDAMHDMHLDDTFAKGAAAVPILARGVGDLGRNLMPGLNDVMNHSIPISAELARGFGEVGASVSDMLKEMVESKGTLEGLRTLFDATGGTIRFLGGATSWLGDRFDGAQKSAAFWSGVMEDMPTLFRSKFRELNDEFEHNVALGADVVATWVPAHSVTKMTAESIGVLADNADEATRHVRDLTASIHRYLTEILAADEANIAWERALDNLTASVQENGHSLDIHTEKGRNNREAVLAAVQAAEAQYESNVKSGMSAKDAARQFAGEVAELERVATKAGFAKAALDALVGKYTIAIAVTGAVDLATSAFKSVFGRRAAGGPTEAGGAYLVGEHGPEILQMGSQRGYVYPTATTTSAGSQGRTAVHINFGGNTDSAFASSFMKLVRTGQIKISSRAVTD